MNEVESRKSWIVTLYLCFFLGGFGVHSFYNNKILKGILQVLTLGGLGIWTMIDLINIILQRYKDGDGYVLIKRNSQNQSLKVAIILMIVFLALSIVSTIRLVIQFPVYINLGKKYTELSQQELEIQAYLYTDATQKQIDEVENNIRSIKGVRSVEFVSKEKALNKMKERLNRRINISSSYLPVSFIIKIEDSSKYNTISNSIKKIRYVKSVSGNNTTIETTTMLARHLQILVIVFIIVTIISIIHTSLNIVSIVLLFKSGLYWSTR